MPKHSSPRPCALAVIVSLLAPIPAFAEPQAEPVPAPIAPAEPEPIAPEVTAPAITSEVVIERVELSSDEVVLRDGSFVRGSVGELAKGSHVTIIVGDESRKIAWAEIARVRLATAPTLAPETPEAAPAAGTDSPPTQPPSGVRVNIDSTAGPELKLFRVTGEFVGGGSAGGISGIGYEPVCSGSCGEVIEGAGTYDFFVGGEGISPSRRFSIVREAEEVTLEVKAGSRVARGGSVVLFSVGAPLLLSGLVLLSVGSLRKVAVGFTAGGGAAVVIGIPLAILGRTVIKRTVVDRRRSQ